MISRSNCANESRIFSVSRPIEVLVLKSWVTETKLTPRLSNSDNKRAKSSNDRLSRSTLYTTTQIDTTCLDVRKQLRESRALDTSSAVPAIVVCPRERLPAVF